MREDEGWHICNFSSIICKLWDKIQIHGNLCGTHTWVNVLQQWTCERSTKASYWQTSPYPQSIDTMMTDKLYRPLKVMPDIRDIVMSSCSHTPGPFCSLPSLLFPSKASSSLPASVAYFNIPNQKTQKYEIILKEKDRPLIQWYFHTINCWYIASSILLSSADWTFIKNCETLKLLEHSDGSMTIYINVHKWIVVCSFLFVDLLWSDSVVTTNGVLWIKKHAYTPHTNETSCFLKVLTQWRRFTTSTV